MASDRKFTAFRPDDAEVVLLAKLAENHGLSASRLIGTAIREKANREGVSATEDEIAEVRNNRLSKQS